MEIIHVFPMSCKQRVGRVLSGKNKKKNKPNPKTWVVVARCSLGSHQHRCVKAATWQSCSLQSWGDAGANWPGRYSPSKTSQEKCPWMLHTGQTLLGCFLAQLCPQQSPEPSLQPPAPSLSSLGWPIRPAPAVSPGRWESQWVTKDLCSVVLTGRVKGPVFFPSRAATNSSLLLYSPSLTLTTTRRWKYEIKLIFLT